MPGHAVDGVSSITQHLHEAQGALLFSWLSGRAERVRETEFARQGRNG
jgi:hypothetical protein